MVTFGVERGSEVSLLGSVMGHRRIPLGSASLAHIGMWSSGSNIVIPWPHENLDCTMQHPSEPSKSARVISSVVEPRHCLQDHIQIFVPNTHPQIWDLNLICQLPPFVNYLGEEYLGKTAGACCGRLPQKQKIRKRSLVWGACERVLRSEAVAPLEYVEKQILKTKFWFFKYFKLITCPLLFLSTYSPHRPPKKLLLRHRLHMNSP